MVSCLKNAIPKYSQLKEILHKEIKEGKFNKGDKFYSGRELVKKFDISRNTAVEALRVLEAEGLVERVSAKGTFIKDISGNKTKNIAVVVSEIFEARHPASISLIKSIEKVLNKAGYHILLISLEHYSKKQQINNLISQKKADGFILVSVPGEVHEWFASKNVPFVIIGNTSLENIPYINVDYFKLVNEGISYLLELGHRKIGFVIGNKKNIGVMRGIRGYENAYNSLGLATQSKYIMTDISNASDVIKATNNLIDAGATAILFDIHMFNYAVDEIRDRGLGIPEDISLMVATQKIRKINAKNSLLTGFEVDINKTYRLAGKMIIDLINGKEVKSKTIPYKFFEGNSCKRLGIEAQSMSKTRKNVHKDFHGAMSYGLKYIYASYGDNGIKEYLRELANTVYSPLSEELLKNGLKGLEEHWKKIFDLEDADYKLFYDDNVLNLKINKCPAISHMKKYNYEIFDKFCEHCRILNSQICQNVGYESYIEYDQNKGSCLQKFWKGNL